MLDALSLLAEVGDDLVVRSVRDTHLAVRTALSAAAASTAGDRHGAVYARPRPRACAPRRLRRWTGSAATGVGPRLEDDPRGRFVSSAVNGLIGDRLLRERPQLAIPMAVRAARRATSSLEPEALAEAFPDATGRLVVFLHGLCENESYWQRHRDRTGTTYAEMLAERGWTPVYAARQHRAAAARERRRR